MADYVCLIQQGQGAERKQAELAEGLRRIGRESFGDAETGAEITWMAFPPGMAFTAGSPSTSSLVIRSVPAGLPQDERETFMNRVCDLWSEVTGCTQDEIVVTAFDGPLPL